jgi:regulator of protease activity HflC (stomatin/prohibitin superfamily)
MPAEPGSTFTPNRPRRPPGGPQWPDGIHLPQFPRFVWLILAGLALTVGISAYIWMVQRVEVGPDELLILVRKVGASLPAGDANPAGSLDTQVMLYPGLLESLGEKPGSTRFKGVVYEARPAGRYFYDPFFWKRIVVPITEIAQNEVGIKVRKYGRPLSEGKIVATEPDERGPLAEVLKPGRYSINPYAYDIKRVPPVFIPPGHVGVQTLYTGAEPADPNQYIVKTDGERGVQPTVLPPGMYYNNPYVRRIDAIDIRSHTLDLHDAEAIRFPSNDSFEVVVDCTVEYAIRQDQAPYVMVAFGDHTDIKDKLILPFVKSLARIEGSKVAAREFITGSAREVFQNAVFDGLRKQCYDQGIEIRATPIRRIDPPRAIADPIKDRQLAQQEILRYQNEIKVAESEAKLAEQQEMQAQNQAIGQANREVVSIVKEAEQQKSVAITDANKRLEVAKLALESGRANAAALVSRGEADAEVLRLGFEARAKPLAEAVTAFGGGDAYAQYYFYQKLAPALKSVLASTDGPFADIFRSLSRNAPAGPPATPVGDVSRTTGGGPQ